MKPTLKQGLFFLLFGMGALLADSYEDEQEEREFENRQYENRQEQNEFDEQQYENRQQEENAPPEHFSPAAMQQQLLMQEEIAKALMGIEK